MDFVFDTKYYSTTQFLVGWTHRCITLNVDEKDHLCKDQVISYTKIFDCVGVSALNSCVVQGSTVYQINALYSLN